jgi:hypothetical protein
MAKPKSSTIRCISQHAEPVVRSDDSVVMVPSGEVEHDAITSHPDNKRLLDEGLIIRVPSNSNDEGDNQ